MEKDVLIQILNKLDNIERLLRTLPEVSATTFLQCQQECESAKWVGKKPSDIYEIAKPNQR